MMMPAEFILLLFRNSRVDCQEIGKMLGKHTRLVRNNSFLFGMNSFPHVCVCLCVCVPPYPVAFTFITSDIGNYMFET